jgi:benzoyl-CoA reductase subunit D
MITVGIDSASQNTKAVAVRDGSIIAMAKLPTEFDVNEAAKRVFELLLSTAGIHSEEVAVVVATGVGRSRVEFAKGNINEVISAAKGALYVKPDSGIVIDIGAEASRAIRLNQDGTIKNYQVNDKCASGGGTFIETMARALQIDTEEMGSCALKHTKDIPMNAQCVVFVESEVISLIHQNETKENIAHAVHMGICNRVCSMVQRLGITDGIVFIGGPSYNADLVECLKKELGKDIFVPRNSEFISALGAALYAAEIA